MNADLQRRIQRYGWDKAAPYYESGWQEQLWPAQESMLSEASLSTTDRVLDISCGTGLVTFPIAEIIDPGVVIGIDLSEEMINKAREINKNNKQENIDFKRMDAENLTFQDGTFDSILCSLGLMYYPHPEKAINEMYRVLQAGGGATSLVWGRRNACGWVDVFPITDGRVKSDVCPLFFQLGTGGLLSQIYRDAGFENITEKRFTIEMHFRDDEHACIAAFLGGAVALAYQKFDENTREEVCREYLESIEQYRDGTGYGIPGEFVVVSGEKAA